MAIRPESSDATRVKLLRRLMGMLRSPAAQPANRPSGSTAILALHDCSQLLIAGNQVLSQPLAFPQDAVEMLFARYLDVINGQCGNASEGRDEGRLDLRIVQQIAEVLRRCQRAGMLQTNLHIDEAAFALYSLFVIEVMVASQEPNWERSAVESTLRANLCTLFRGWLDW